jgi:hypothetical protein
MQFEVGYKAYQESLDYYQPFLYRHLLACLPSALLLGKDIKCRKQDHDLYIPSILTLLWANSSSCHLEGITRIHRH